MVSKISLTTSNRSSIATVTTFAVMILSRVIVAPRSEPTHTMRDPSIGVPKFGDKKTYIVYGHEPDLKALHANVTAFIEKTPERHSRRLAGGRCRAPPPPGGLPGAAHCGPPPASWYTICLRWLRRFQSGPGDV